jgi:hypothetical protein
MTSMGVTLQEAKKRAMDAHRSIAIDTKESRRETTGYQITFADLKIRTKDKRIVPFVPNEVQIRYLDELCPRWREGLYDVAGLRELILKGRQEGFTTLIQAIYFCITLNEPNTQTVVLAHDLDSTETIFQMIKRFYEYLPPEKKPFAKYQSKRAFYWPSIDCYYSVGSAARGGTVNNLHFSEAAWHPDAESIITGLLQSVPLGGNAFLESTANGIGNYYQREWEAAGNSESTFRQYFCAWFENTEYRVERPPGFKRTPEESKRAEIYGLDDGQLAWYRIKAKELKEKVKQEYPDNPNEAFLSSGHPYFDRLKLTATVGSTPLPDSPFDPHSRLGKNWDHIQVFKLPEEGHAYIVSADTAEGITDQGDADYDSAHVLDAETWGEVAHIHGRWDTHEYGILLADLAWFYNTALLGIERNNHGHAVINSALHSAGYPPQKGQECSGLYYHPGEYDEKTKKREASRPGWPTNTRSKIFALDGLATSIIDGSIKLSSKETVAELVRYVRLPGGKAGGESGSHDDRVISLMIADVLLKLGFWKKTFNPVATSKRFFELMAEKAEKK